MRRSIAAQPCTAKALAAEFAEPNKHSAGDAPRSKNNRKTWQADSASCPCAMPCVTAAISLHGCEIACRARHGRTGAQPTV